MRGIEIADDDGEKIVEIMGDAAGEMADRIQPLRLPQHGFRGLATILFGIEALRSLQHHEQCAEQQRGRRYAEDEIRRHAAHPVVSDLGGVDAGEHIKRKAGQAAVPDAPLDVVVSPAEV